MKFNKYYILAGMLGLGSLGLTSCGDAAEEITDFTLDRLLSPIDIEVKGVTVDGATVNWKATEGAAKYMVEVFANDSLTFADEHRIEFQEITGTSTELVALTYDTDYSVRVSALDANNSNRNSKFSKAYFRTSAQQILSNPKATDILDTSVDLKWEEGETDVTFLELTGSDGEIITYILSAEDIANSKATVPGLSPETEYTAKLYFVDNGVNKQRGNRTFKTIMSLEGATVVSEGDNLASIIANAEAGAVIALRTGTYVLNPNDEGQAGAAKVNNTIKVQSIYPTAPATIKGRFEIYNGAGLELGQVKLDGSDNSTTDQLINYKNDGVHAPLYIHDCDLTSPAGKGLIYVNVAADIESVTYKNNVIHDVKCDGGDAFDFRKGAARAFVFQNNTVYNIATMPRDIFRMDGSGNTVATAGEGTIVITNNTFDTIGGSGKRLLYIRFGPNYPITFKNNVVSNSQVYISNQSTTCLGQDALAEGATTYEITSKAQVSDNNYFNAPNMTASTTDKAINDKTGALSLDPKYDKDFNITNEDLIKNKIGNVK